MEGVPTCGYCDAPLYPSGPSLYFCPPTTKGGESACQRNWWDQQAGRTVELPYENALGADTTVPKPHLRAKVA